MGIYVDKSNRGVFKERPSFATPNNRIPIEREIIRKFTLEQEEKIFNTNHEDIEI